MYNRKKLTITVYSPFLVIMNNISQRKKGDKLFEMNLT